MTPASLLDWIGSHIDDGFGPEDAGWVEAAYNHSTGQLEVTYTDDESGEVTTVHLAEVTPA